MQLKCRACGCIAQKDRKIRSNFADIAYEDIINWTDPGQVLPPFDDLQTFQQHSSTPPKPGTRRMLHVSFPFSCGIGETFHTLYLPPLSHFNGWEDYPQEIEQSALVACRMEQILDQTDYSAWIEVKVLRLTPLAEMILQYPACRTAEPLEAFDFSAEIFCFQYKNWFYSSCGIEGDFGQWKLFYTDEAAVRHLILMGDWDFHTNNVYCGNIISK